MPFVPLASGAPALKETKDTHTQRETVSFVALSEGANIDEIKEPEQRLAQRSNVGKRYFRRLLWPGSNAATIDSRHAELASASTARAIRPRQRQLFFAQRRKDVAPAAKRLFILAVRPAAPLTWKRICRPKPSSSCLCAFARNKKGCAEGQVRPWTLKQVQGDEDREITAYQFRMMSHLQNGALVALLDPLRPQEEPIWAIYP